MSGVNEAVKRVLAFSLIAGLIAIATISIWVPVFIYRPIPLLRPNASAWGLPAAQEVTIPSGAGNRLFGWWLHPPNPAAPVALIVHGRSGNISTRAQIAAKLSADGFGVLLFDFRGYGRSTGRSDEKSLTEDAMAAYDWLRRQGVRADQIIVIGQSLGDAPAAQLSASRAVRALVLVSPFTNLPEAISDRLTWPALRLLPWPVNRFEVRRSVENLSVPVLLIASHSDGLVPFKNSQEVALSARDLHWLVIDGQRHDGLLAAVASTGRLSKALRSLSSAAPQLRSSRRRPEPRS